VNVLGVDVAGARGGVALLAGARTVVRDLGEPGAHAERIVGAGLEVLAEAGIGWDALDLVAVGVGPGSFTGVRVGLAYSLGLAEARGLRVTGCGSLDILARACYDAIHPATGTYLIPAADVRRGEVVLARFRAAEGGAIRESGDRLAPVTDPGPPPSGPVVVAGEGSALLWPDRTELVRWTPGGGERALAAARLGADALGNDALEPAVPRYARPADARPRRGGA
jgi:tRNA threonylcarbamoyladenosine biosynthesis protein TsaB